MLTIEAEIGFWRVWAAIWDQLGPQRAPSSKCWCFLHKFVPSWDPRWGSKMEQFSDGGWLLGALVSSPVFGLLSEVVLG